MNKQKIIIAGIGGVGGYFGGKISKYAETSHDCEVHFFVRGQHSEAIRSNGLSVESPAGNFITHPATAGDDAGKIGEADLILLCTKTYGLEECLQQLKPCIGSKTIFLPLQNGTDCPERIRAIYPENEIWEGCVYLVARRTAPGKILDSGNIRKLFFGTPGMKTDNVIAAEKLFVAAGIEALASEEITKICWEKFLFISSLATLTSAYDKNVGDLRNDEKAMHDLPLMIAEVRNLALARNIIFGEEMIEHTIEKIRNILPPTMTSMHSDFRAGGSTEIESLTGYVVRGGKKLNVDVSLFEQYYNQLKSRR